MQEHNAYGNAAGWFFVGGVLGACSALLLAPATGKRTRDRLTRAVRRTRETVTDFADDLADTTRQVAEKAGRIGERVMHVATDTSQAARELVGSFGNGSPARR